jgi:hypothetical protein
MPYEQCLRSIDTNHTGSDIGIGPACDMRMHIEVMGVASHIKRGQLVVRNCNSPGQRPGGFNPYHYF